ncbi:MAG: heme-binding protein [Pseudomonadota bacterium]
MRKRNIALIGVFAVTAVAGVLAYGAAQAVEKPKYKVEAADGDFEVRQYPELVVAQVERGGSRQLAARNAFSPLASYIFAKNRSGEKIAMTAPVTQEPSDDGWTVSFIMPAGRTLDDLPVPAQDVRLAEVEPRLVAAVRFSGRWTDERFAKQASRLKEWVEARGLTPVGDVEFAYYNDPFTPAFLRRNEVMVEIKR